MSRRKIENYDIDLFCDTSTPDDYSGRMVITTAFLALSTSNNNKPGR